MTGVLWAFDVVIACTLIGLALMALVTSDLFKSVVLFIAFGLVMAMAWARLQAVDIALAEAAIGAGLTGALFLNAIGRSEAPRSTIRFGGALRATRHSAATVAAVLVAAGLAVAIGAALTSLAAGRAGLLPHVAAALPRSGVTNPVTAVLLNFRAYDTLLEVAVLLLALLGVWSLAEAPRRSETAAPPGPVLMGLVYVLVPASGVVGGYLLWAGTTAPGGAFQAGAVLAASGVLLLTVGRLHPSSLKRNGVRLAVALGAAAFLGVGVSAIAAGRSLLEYPPSHAGVLILAVELLLTLTIALVLVALFADGAPAAKRAREDTR